MLKSRVSEQREIQGRFGEQIARLNSEIANVQNQVSNLQIEKQDLELKLQSAPCLERRLALLTIVNEGLT
jgi:hypothetical protein